MTIKSVGKRLIVKEIKSSEEEKKLIITVSPNEPIRAQVICCGSDVDSLIHDDNIVILPARTGSTVEIDGEKYLSIYEDQILAVIEK